MTVKPTGQGQDPGSPSDPPNTPGNVSEDDKNNPPAESKFVPYERFKEVNDGFKEAKEEMATMKEELATLKEKVEPKPLEPEEPAEWGKEAEEKTVQKAVKEMQTLQEKETEENQVEEVKIEKAFKNIEGMGHEVNDETKAAVLEKMVKSEEDLDVYEAYQETQEEQRTQAQKEGGFIPPSRGGSKPSVPAFEYKDIHGKDPMEIAEEASSE